MNKKTLTFCLVCVVLLVLANAVALFFLYYPSMKGRGAEPVAEPVAEAAVEEPSPEAVEPVVAVSDTVATIASPVVSPVASPAAVKVPEGPFQVKNSATGKMNSLSQNDDYSLSLKDETEATQWVMPFSGDICGRVATVDFYANGKLQFLFCSGSKLCLVDRLGRMVSGFPVVLGKEVLLGPDVYDFNNQRRYNIVVLNRDNTIDMYNLKGEKPQKWHSIAPKGQITGLPGYLEEGGKSYWTVPLADGSTAKYSFYGDIVY